MLFLLCSIRAIEKLIDSLDKKVTTVRLDIHEVQSYSTRNKRINKLEKICNDFQAENAALRNLVAQQSKESQILTRNIDHIEQYSRGSNILVHGIQLPQDNSTETDIWDKTIDVINSNLNLNITPVDVNSIHRLPRTAARGAAASDPAASDPAANRPPAVIVQFVSKRLRNHVISKRRDLKGKRLMLTDHLTARRSLLLRKATDLVAANKPCRVVQ